MINMNESMKQLMQKSGRGEDRFKLNQISDKVVNGTKLVKSCVIFDETDKPDETEINFNRVLKFVKDWTGYEISCNELRFSTDEIPSEGFLYFVERLNNDLSKKYEKRQFGIVLSVNDDEVALRFHTYRENEGLWLDKDLNKYGNPILYRV